MQAIVEKAIRDVIACDGNRGTQCKAICPVARATSACNQSRSSSSARRRREGLPHGGKALRPFREAALRRKAGQLLSGIDKAKGAAEPGTNRGATLSYATTASKKTLPEYGITREEAASGFLSRVGLLSSLPKCSE